MRDTGVRIFVTVCLLLFAVGAGAQEKSGKKMYYGVKGGYNYSNVSGVNVANMDIRGYSGFNVGGFIQWRLPLMFALQPEVIYYQAGVNTECAVQGKSVEGKLYNGNIYIPINLQWGPQVGIFRFYALVSPFIGFNISNRFKYSDDFGTHIEVLTKNSNCFMGGVGLGLGIDIGKIYFSAKYNWNFNRMFSEVPEMLDENLSSAKMKGLELSLAFGF